MSEGKNSLTKKKLVTIEFDPFKERTITRVNKKINFKHSGANIDLTVSHWKSGEFDYCRITIATEAMGDNCHELSKFIKIEILADQEPIVPVDLSTYSNEVSTNKGTFFQGFMRGLMGKKKKYVGGRQGGGHVNFSNESARKIASADKIEVRYFSKGTYSDLNDSTESEIQNAFAIVYNEAVESIFAEKEDVTKEVPAKKMKLFTIISYAVLCIFAFSALMRFIMWLSQ